MLMRLFSGYGAASLSAAAAAAAVCAAQMINEEAALAAGLTSIASVSVHGLGRFHRTQSLELLEKESQNLD